VNPCQIRNRDVNCTTFGRLPVFSFFSLSLSLSLSLSSIDEGPSSSVYAMLLVFLLIGSSLHVQTHL